jgi:hypothetical protein
MIDRQTEEKNGQHTVVVIVGKGEKGKQRGGRACVSPCGWLWAFSRQTKKKRNNELKTANRTPLAQLLLFSFSSFLNKPTPQPHPSHHPPLSSSSLNHK